MAKDCFEGGRDDGDDTALLLREVASLSRVISFSRFAIVWNCESILAL